MSSEVSRQLVQRLLRPDAYPHPVRDLQLEETHISWVLLTGDYAYKIKKPVKLDFLDFSTLEQRRFYCGEELRLNRRFAPQLYLDVVAIGGPVDSPRMGEEDGEVIEYAVRLKQFRKGNELRDLLGHEAVSEERVQEFGHRLADLHAAAAPSQDYGTSEQTRSTLADNVAELTRALGRSHEDVDRISRWLEGQSRLHAALIDARCRAGGVRECHGDLHAGNVVRIQDRLVPFDCIEFNPALRFIDVSSDAAFLKMDLIARDHPALAYAFINGWLENGGDYDGLPLLRLFETYRALVRAKVAAIEKNDAGVNRYLATASAAIADRKPMLIAACGLSGSGKTWLSTRLMTAFGALRVRSDVERKRMAGLKAHESSSSLKGQDIYTLEFNDRVYRRLLDVARTALTAGEHIIIDAASLKRAERESFIDLARALGAPVRILHCTAPLGMLRSRLVQRQATGKDASEATAAVLERQLEHWEPFSDLERPHVIEIETTAPDPVGRAVMALREVARSP